MAYISYPHILEYLYAIIKSRGCSFNDEIQHMLRINFSILKMMGFRKLIEKVEFKLNDYIYIIWDKFYFIIYPNISYVPTCGGSGEIYELKNWFYKYAKGTVVDVGAYIGGYTVRASRLANEVIAIEPNPISFKILEMNCKINNCKNVKLINKAVWKEKVKIKFPISYQISSISKEGILVEADILDNILYDIDKIDFMKIDIEGAEVIEFEGMKESLKKTKILMIELFDENLRIMYKRLKSLNFKLIDANGINYLFEKNNNI